MFSSVEEVLVGLRRTGYITDEITATIVHLAAKLNKPILLEGPPGSGKTELAYAVAKATSAEVERLECFEGIDEEKAIGRFDEGLQRLAVELRSKSGPVEWELLKQELHGQKFFSAGPLLRALQQPRCVLLIDELDKVDQAFEAMLLELLSVWQMSIPKLGLVTQTIPFVVLTSNEERRIRRSPAEKKLLFANRPSYPRAGSQDPSIENPRGQRRISSRHGGAGQGSAWLEPGEAPSISEMLDLAQALKVLGKQQITPEMRDILLPLLAKTEADRKKLLMRDGFASLIYDAQQYRSGSAGGCMKIACFMLVLFSSCSAWSRSVQASRQEAEYYVTAYALHYRVPIDFVRALIAQESGWQPCAISTKGAAGLMQLMPATAADWE